MANNSEIERVVYVKDGNGHSLKIRLWKNEVVSDFEGVGKRMEQLHNSFKPREDDIFILAYTKCGTHWIHEIMHFLLTEQATRRPATKEMSMVECVDLVDIDKKPDNIPRVLNCHVYKSLLPDKVTKQCKFIYIIRNPKDVMVSLFHHATNIVDYEYSGTINGFVKIFQEGLIDGGSYYQHAKEFMKLLKENQPENMHFIEYEKLKRNPEEEIKRLHKFTFGGKKELSDQLLEQIMNKVSFQSMQKDRENDLGDVFKENTSFYRKGDVGDWKNWLNEEQSREIDKKFDQELQELEGFYKPVYE